MQAAGFVLVGGLSTRMGQDKALLPSGPDLLVVEVAREVAAAAGNVALVGNPERYQSLGLPCIPDLRPSAGPLGGIEAALAAGRSDLNLMVACDMPGLSARLLRSLLQSAQETQQLCTVTRDKTGTVHPLCAVYRSACLPVIQRALQAGRLRLMDVLKELHAVHFGSGEIVLNVNTPEEWSAWREQQVAP